MANEFTELTTVQQARHREHFPAGCANGTCELCFGYGERAAAQHKRDFPIGCDNKNCSTCPGSAQRKVALTHADLCRLTALCKDKEEMRPYSEALTELIAVRELVDMTTRSHPTLPALLTEWRRRACPDVRYLYGDEAVVIADLLYWLTAIIARTQST